MPLGAEFLRVIVLRAATLLLSFLLFAAASSHARGREEKPVPPLPIPDVDRTAAAHFPGRLSPPLPRPRPVPAAPSPAPVVPKKTVVPIND